VVVPAAARRAPARPARRQVRGRAPQGAFWRCDLLDDQGALTVTDLPARRRARPRRGAAASCATVGTQRIEGDVDSADASEVSGTPSFFINGQRYTGPVEEEPLREALELARQNARAAAGRA
jgi:hypothetical protein